jgi:RNA polymerase sigma-70 factor (ECF subfamily)
MPQEQEFIQLLNKHQNIIHKVCSVYMNDYAAKEDLFQEVTLQAWKAYPNFRGDAKFSTWLYRIALNTAITFYRKEKKQIPTFTAEVLPEAALEEHNPIEEQVKAMYKAIGELSKIDKALIMLYLEDYNYNDIGEMLGISANNVAVKINRLKVKLKEQTQKHYQLS